MKQIPLTTFSPVLRTDFGDQAAWEAVREELQEADELGFDAQIEFIDDPAFSGITVPQVIAALPPGYHHTFIILVDKSTLAAPEHLVLVVNLAEGSGAQFRAIPAAVPAVQNNLFIANMDFEDFSGAVDGDGVFRHF